MALTAAYSVSAIIINHNGGQDVLNCLKALFQQPFPLQNIIVVDNASTDNSPSSITGQYPDIDLIHLDQNLGPSRARNIGLERAASDLVLILDDDIYVHQDCIRQLYSAYEQYVPAVVCPRILFHPNREIVQCDAAEPHFTGTLKLRNADRPLHTLPASASKTLACISACMLVNREIVLSSGGFDELYFFYFEDLEFSLRIRSLGHSILFESGALVYHNRGAGTPGLSYRGHTPYPERRAYLHIRHRWVTLLIHYRMRTMIVLSPVLALYEMAMFIVVIKRGWFSNWWKAVLSIIDNIPDIAAKRQFIKVNRKRCDRDLLTGGPLPFASGFVQNPMEQMALRVLSAILNSYWHMAKFMIG